MPDGLTHRGISLGIAWTDVRAALIGGLFS
jgi:hypothetical protein